MLNGNITFSPVCIIDPAVIGEYDIPSFFDSTGDRGGQISFSSGNGLFIAHATDVASMFIDNNRNIGVTQKFVFNKPTNKISVQRRISHR